MAFDPFEQIDKEEDEFYGVDPNTGAIEDKEYYYNPITGRSDADAPLSQEENFANAGFLDNILSGIKAGASGVLSGQATLADTFAGVGGDMADDLKAITERNTRTHNWNFDTITSNPMAYITDPQGLAYDVGNMTGSALMMGAETAALGTAAGVGNLSTLANYFAGKAAAHGLPSLAKALSSKYGSLIVANVAKTPIEVSSESGNVIQDMKEEGITDKGQLQKAAAVNALIQTPLLTLSNSVESLGLGTMFGKNISSKAGKAALGATGVVGGALQQSWEEGMQRGASDYAKGEQPGGLTSVVDPFEWTQGQKDEAAAAFGPGMLFGGAGALGSRIARKWADRDTIEANAREFNPNDPNDNGPLPESGGPDNNNNGPSGNGSDAEMKDETIDTTATEGPEETVSSENEEATAPASSGEDISSVTDDLASAITGQESGGDTEAVNSSTGAYGSMQILPSNWDEWSKEALGHVGDMNNVDDYNATAKHKLEQYVRDYGPEGAAAAWYAGEQNGKRYADGLSTGIDDEGNEYSFDAPLSNGPSVNQYVASVMSKMQNGGGSSAVSSFSPEMMVNTEGKTWDRLDDSVDVENVKDVTKAGLADIADVYYNTFGVPLTVTSGNDSGVHADGPHSHYAGVKLDVSGGVLDDQKKRHQFIEECEKRGIEVLDEYEHPSPNSTGGHLDLDFTNYNGGGNSRRAGGGVSSTVSGIPLKDMTDYLKENQREFDEFGMKDTIDDALGSNDPSKIEDVFTTAKNSKDMVDYLKENQHQFNDPDLNNAIDEALTSKNPNVIESVYNAVKKQNDAADVETQRILSELRDEMGLTDNIKKQPTAGPEVQPRKGSNITTTQTTAQKQKGTLPTFDNLNRIPFVHRPFLNNKIYAPYSFNGNTNGYSNGLINLAQRAMNGDQKAAEVFSKIREGDRKMLEDMVREQPKMLQQAPQAAPQTENVGSTVNSSSAQENAPVTAPGSQQQGYANSPRGNTTTIESDDQTKYKAQYRLADANDLVVSHDTDSGMNIRTNPDYPSQFQPRDRNNATMRQQVISISNKLNPGRLMDSQMINTGAPVVNSNGIVLNGNGRAMGIKAAYRNGRGEAYKKALKANAQRLGLDPAAIDKMKNPVLVREVNASPDEMEKIITSKVGGAEMNAAERAVLDSKKVKDSTLERFIDNTSHSLVTSANANDYVLSVLKDITGGDPNKLNPLLNDRMEPSKEGVERARNAVFAMAYGDGSERLLSLVTMDTDSPIKSYTTSMVQVSPVFALLNKRIQDGMRYNINVTSPIAEAGNRLDGLRKNNTKLSIYLQEQALLPDLSPEAHAILQFVDESGRGSKNTTEFFTTMANIINQLGNPKEDATALFQDEGVTPDKIKPIDVVDYSYHVMKGDAEKYALGQTGTQLPQESNVEQGDKNVNPEPEQAEKPEGENGNARERHTAENNEIPAESGKQVQTDEAGQTGEVNSEADAEQKISSIVGKEEIVINTAKNTDRQELEATIENRTKSAITTQMMGAVADGNNDLARTYDQLSRKFRDSDYKKSLVNRIADNVLNRLKETTGESQATAQQENKPAVDTTQKPYSNGKFTVDTYEHTKTHQQLARVAFNKGHRVGHDDYTAMRDLAQKHNGHYSRFRGINAFLFPTDKDRDSFLNEGRPKFDFPTPEKENNGLKLAADEGDYKKSFTALEAIKGKINNAKTVDELPAHYEIDNALRFYMDFPITDGRLSEQLRRYAGSLKAYRDERNAELESARARLAKSDNGSKRYEDGSVVTPSGKVIAPIDEWKDPKKNPFVNGQVLNMDTINNLSEEDANKVLDMFSDKEKKDAVREEEKNLPPIKPQDFIIREEKGKYVVSTPNGLVQKYGLSKTTHVFNLMKEHNGEGSSSNPFKSGYKCRFNTMEDAQDFVKAADDIINDRNQEAPEPKPQPVAKAKPEKNPQKEAEDYFKNHFIVTTAPPDVKMTPAVKNDTMKAEEKEGKDHDGTARKTEGEGGSLAGGHRGVQSDVLQAANEKREGTGSGRNSKSPANGSGKGEKVSGGRTQQAKADDQLHEEPEHDRGDEAGNQGTDAGRTNEYIPEVEAEPEPQAKPAKEQKARVNDYHMTEVPSFDGVGEKTLFDQNLQAIQLLKQLQMDNRMATKSEQEVLAKYSGWGTLANAFTGNPVWKKENQELRDTVSEEEYNSIKSSVNTAFYTPPELVQTIWDGIKKMGFKGGKVLDPSMGTGIFYATMPKQMYNKSSLYGVEMEQLSGNISKQLFQSADISISPYEETKLAPDFFDLAVTNVPFANDRPYDPKYNKKHFKLHNYYFVKTLNMVRPGGLVAFLTSTSTMDNSTEKEGNQLRATINNMADLVAAFRLPDTTFKQSAKTGVTTDLIILQRRVNPKQPAPYAQKWMDTVKIDLDEKKRPGYIASVAINEYYKNHPENMLGRPVADSQYNNYWFQASVSGTNTDGTAVDFIDLLKKAVSKLPSGIYKQTADDNNGPKQQTTILAGDERDFTISERDGKLYKNNQGKLTELNIGDDKAKMVRSYLKLRDAGKKLLQDQSDPDVSDAVLEKERKDVNGIYDNFVKKFGYLNNKNNLKYYGTDPDYGMIGAFERYTEPTKTKKESAEKADIFFKRTTGKYKAVTHADSPTDALALSISQKGKVDMDYMAKLMGTKDKNAIYEKLEGQIYKDPTSKSYVLAEEYLSGSVRKKLEQAREMAKTDSSYKVNVEALERVQPAPLNETQIKVNIGANWIPVSYYNQFLNDLIGRDAVRVDYSELTSKWLIENGKHLKYYRPEYEKWSTSRKSFRDILNAALNMKSIVVTNKLDDGKEETDREATEAVNTKIEELKDTFTNWLWGEPERKKRLLKIYNDTFNDNVLRNYDGSRLDFTGTGMNEKIQLRPHQKDAVWRIMQRKNVLLAHCVGSGKTFTMQAAGMEMKRLGIIHKPMYSVPANVVPQFASDFRTLYPDAKILVLTSKDLPGAKITDEFNEKLDTTNHKEEKDQETGGKKSKRAENSETVEQQLARLEKRRRTLSRIGTEDWDAIIISHELLKQMPLSPEAYNAFYKEQLALLEQAIYDAKANDDGKLGKRQVKALEAAKKNLQDRLKRDIAEDKKEVVIPFENLGIDQLFVDEADLFKNLTFYTTHNRLKGISQSHAARSTDLYVKARWLSKTYNGGGVCFATGTPISNSMNEMYTMMRYLDYSGLEKLRLMAFDSWLTQFGQVTEDYEPDTTGDKPKKVERASFNNVPQLISEYRKFADIKMIEDLPYLKLPKLKDGHDTVIEVPASDTFTNKLKPEMIHRLEKIQHSSDKKADNTLKWIGDYRKMTLDLRLYDSSIPESEAANKINACCDEAYKKWKETTKATDTTAENGAQLIFCDVISADKDKNKSKNDESDNEDENENKDEFAEESKEAKSTYQWIKDGLVRRGIPENQIAFVHDAKNNTEKKALFDRVDNGDVRILIGSTTKMGAGTNCQHHLVALHHLTLPWRPRDIEQREGRILRQGNLNKEVEIFHYVTKGSFDQYNLNMLKNKAKMIHAVMHGDSDISSMDDVGEETVNFGELEAVATQDPAMLEFTKLSNTVNKLRISQNAWNTEIMNKNQELARLPARIKANERIIADVTKDLKIRKNIKGDNFRITLNGHTFTKQKDAQDYLKQNPGILDKPVKVIIGSIAGMKITVMKQGSSAPSMEISGPGGIPYIVQNPYSVASIAYTVNAFPEMRKKEAEEELKNCKRSKEILEEEVKKPFSKEKELNEAVIKLNKLKAQIGKAGNGAKIASQQAAATEAEATDVSDQYSIVSDDIPDTNIQRSLDSLKQEVRDAFPQAEISDIDNSQMKVKTAAGTITVDLHKNIIVGEKAEKKARKEHGMDSTGNIVVEGYYKQGGLNKDAVIALSQESSEGSAYHEAFHAAWDMALNDKEKAAMTKYYSKHTGGKTVSEAMADGYKEWKKQRTEGKGSYYGKLFQKVNDFVNKAKAILTGVENVHNVMRKVAEGNVWNRSAEINDAAMRAASNRSSNTAEQQEYKSAGTSLNQIPAMFKRIPWKQGTKNIDIGGGKYNTATEYLRNQHDVENIVFDPYNRTKAENEKAMEAIRGKADTVTVANVLNVIKESAWRRNVILQAAKALKKDGTAYFQIYEGNKSGVGNATQKQQSYQNNMKASEYVGEIQDYFKDVDRKGNVIIAKNPDFNPTDKAVWSMDDLATDDVAFSIRNATDNLRTKLKNDKDDRIKVAADKVVREMSITQTLLRSPSYIAEHVKRFAAFFKMAVKSQETQEHLRNLFNKQLNRIHHLYLHSKQDVQDWAGLLWQGDAEGKEYSRKELEEMGVAENVANAYSATRALINHVYKMLNETRNHVETIQKRMSKDQLKNLMKDKFAEITRVEDRGPVKKGSKEHEYLVTYKRPKTWRTTDTVDAKMLKQLKSDPNIQVLSEEKKGKNYEVVYEERRGDIHKLEGYIPHFFHDFFVVVKDEDGNNVVVGSGRNIKDAYKKAEAYIKEHPEYADDVTIAPKSFNFEDDAHARAVEIGDGQFFAMVKKCEDQLNMTMKEARDFLSDKVKTKNRHRFYGNFLQRKGALGFEENIDWVLHHYLNSAARYIALEPFKSGAISLFERYFGAWNKDYNDNQLAHYVKDYINDVNGNPNSIEMRINEWLNSIPFWRDFVSSKFGDRAALELTNRITSTISVAKLGFCNVSSAMMNLIQILNAYGITGDMMATVKACGHAIRPNFRDLRVLRDCFIEDDVRLDAGAGGYTAFRPRSILGKTMGMFSFFDSYSRKVAALSAFYHAIKEGKTYSEAIEYAKMVNRKANFDYSPVDAPAAFRKVQGSVIGDLMLQFQKYKAKQLELMYDITFNGPKGKALKFWGMYFLIAGLYQFPVSDWFNDLFKEILGVDYKLKIKGAIMDAAGDSEIGRGLARIAMYGLLAARPINIDISQRAGMGDFVLPPNSTLVDIVGGPTISTITQMYIGIHKNDPIQVLKGFSPALGNYAQVLLGKTVDKKGRTMRGLDSTYDKIVKAVGFRLADESINSDISQVKRQRQSELQEERQGFIRSLLDKEEAGEPRTAEDVQKMKEFGITNKKLKQYRNQCNSSFNERVSKTGSKKFRESNDALMNFAQ
jgi:N12 class adenine-specific DNA methylase